MGDAVGVFPSRYDDYDYGEVNQLLERNLKVYIKTVACYPEKTTRRMYNLFWRHFRHSEKVQPTGEGGVSTQRGIPDGVFCQLGHLGSNPTLVCDFHIYYL